MLTSLVIESIRRVCELGSMHDSKDFVEKGVQPVKNEFASKKKKVLVI